MRQIAELVKRSRAPARQASFVTDTIGLKLQKRLGQPLSKADYLKIWNGVCVAMHVPQHTLSGWRDV